MEDSHTHSPPAALPMQKPDASDARAYGWLAAVELMGCTVRWRRADLPRRPRSRTTAGSATRGRCSLG
eukprot:1167213-Pyramimonas_sp.AAC.1